MTGEPLVAFSRVTDDYLFYKLDNNWRPAVRMRHACKAAVFYFLTFKMYQISMIDSAREDALAQHVALGNGFLAFTSQPELICISTGLISLSFAVLMTYHMYLVKFDPKSLLMMTQIAADCFEALTEKQKRRLVAVTKFVENVVRIQLALICSYEAYSVISTFETTTTAKVHAIIFAVVHALAGINVVMVWFSFSTITGVCCVHIVRKLQNLSMDQDRFQVQLLNEVNMIFVTAHKLNTYWKQVNFLLAGSTGMFWSMSMSTMVLNRSMPTLIKAIYISTPTLMVAANSVVVLFGAYVHSKVNCCYSKLLKFCWGAPLRGKLKLNNVVKKFSNLEVFTLGDVAPITFDTYRDVCITINESENQNNYLSSLLLQMIGNLLSFFSLGTSLALSQGPS